MKIVEVEIGEALTYHGVIRVSRHENDLQVRTQSENLVRKLPAVHAGHHDISENEIDDFDVLAIEVKTIGGVNGFDHLIATEFENFAGDVANKVFVFDEKNSLVGNGSGVGAVQCVGHCFSPTDITASEIPIGE